MPTSRYLAALRRLESRRPPCTTLVSGPDGLCIDFAYRFEHLGTDDFAWISGDDPNAVALLSLTNPERQTRLVVWENLPSPRPELVSAIQKLTPTHGTWLVATTDDPPDEMWVELFGWHVSCKMSPAQLRDWVQGSLGGAPRDAVDLLLERCGHDPETVLREMRKVLFVTDRPQLADIECITIGDTATDFVSALVGCHQDRAEAAAKRVVDPTRIVRETHYQLLCLWQMVEARPPISRVTLRDASKRLSIPYTVVEQLAPFARLYSRQKIRRRIEALAIADRELHLGTRPNEVLQALVHMW